MTCPSGARDCASRQVPRRGSLVRTGHRPLGAQQDRKDRILRHACLCRLGCHHGAQTRWYGICKWEMLGRYFLPLRTCPVIHLPLLTRSFLAIFKHLFQHWWIPLPTLLNPYKGLPYNINNLICCIINKLSHQTFVHVQFINQSCECLFIKIYFATFVH